MLKRVMMNAIRMPRMFYNHGPQRGYKQVKDLNEVMYTAAAEEEQRTAKFLEYTTKIYKPSKTITFDRNGELLLYSCDNFRHSKVYTKYPYCLIDASIPLIWYNFFVDPFGLSWGISHTLFHLTYIVGWLPHYLYIRSIGKRVHKIFLMRGGKYVRIVLQDGWGATWNSWCTIRDFNLLTQDHRSVADSETFEFLTDEGQMRFETALQIENFTYYNTPQHDDVVFFMKEGSVHEPEIFEQTLRGYNIDTTDFEINTEDNFRALEANKNI